MSGSKKSFGVRVYKEYFSFASSHFLVFDDGRREELHGHNYQVRVAIDGEVGAGEMVLDFCRLKPMVRRLCDALDHRTLLAGQNERVEIEELEDDHVSVVFQRTDGGRDRVLFPARDVLVLPLRNTSTERLAELLANQLLDVVQAEYPDAVTSSLTVEVEEAGGQCGYCKLEGLG